VTCPVLREVLDPAVVARVPTRGHAYAVKSSQDAEPWAWSYLAACLATALGYDEARAVVLFVMTERAIEEVVADDGPRPKEEPYEDR
jgi:hypothetical protein